MTPAPYTQKHYVNVVQPSIDTRELRDDLARLRDGIPQMASSELGAVRALHHTLLSGKYDISAVLAGDRLIAVEAGDTCHIHYGAGAGYRHHHSGGLPARPAHRRGGRASARCPTRRPPTVRRDLAHRIRAGNDDNVETLRKCVTQAAEYILHTVAKEAGIHHRQIYRDGRGGQYLHEPSLPRHRSRVAGPCAVYPGH